MNNLIITPKTKVAELLDSYPQLEDLLIEIAPVFKKLKNPVLRRTIAKLTSLEQAAAVGGVGMDAMINKLRAAVGQDKLDAFGQNTSYVTGMPSWFAVAKISKSFDARPVIARGEHPLGEVMRDLKDLADGTILELITPFMPAPLIDQANDKGYLSYTIQEQPDLVKTYFVRGK
ncbi:MAG: hypothetical protein QG635_834 [Bacteroidota bacterium]|nr:hypothetical protein [Bacteroidota bacterium]